MNEKIFTNFISKIQTTHQLIHQKMIFSYLCNFFKNSKNKNFLVVRTINEVLKEIRYIGKFNNFQFNDKSVKSFFISSYLYYLDQTFESLLSVFTKSKIIPKNLEEKFKNSEYVKLTMIIRNTLHHPFEIWISNEELTMIYNSKNINFQFNDKKLIKKLIDLNKDKRYKFSLFDYSPNMPNTITQFFNNDKDMIYLFSFDMLNNDDINSISIGFDFDLILKNYFLFLIEIRNEIEKEIKIFSKELGNKFNLKIKSVSKLKNSKDMILKLENLLFDKENNMFRNNEDMSVKTTFIAKHKLLQDFLSSQLNSKSIILKMFNKYLQIEVSENLTLEEFKRNKNNYGFYSKKFFDKFSMFWKPNWSINLHYAYEKISCNKIVFLTRKEKEEEFHIYSNFEKQYDNVKASINSCFYQDNDPVYLEIFIFIIDIFLD